MKVKVGDIVCVHAARCTPPDVWVLITSVEGHRDAELHGRALVPFRNWANLQRWPGDKTIFNSSHLTAIDNDNPEALAAVARLALEGRL